MKKKLILAIIVMLLVLNCCGKNTNIIQVPEEITKGYELADYDIYKLPAKENGKKYEKIYVVGKISEDLFENSKDKICAYLIDDKAQKWYIIIDSNKSINNYKELLNKDICVCGIYIGSLKKDGSACLNVNKIFNIATNETIVSNYYGNYEGEFDENGKVISNDFDKDDNTIIDFHSIQIQIPYNYIEENLNNEEATYSIYEEDGAFVIQYDKEDCKSLIDSYNKYSKYDSLKESWENDEGWKLIDSNYYNDIFIYEINKSGLRGHVCIKIAEDGFYSISLLSDLSSRFNRENDFKEIVDSIKKLSPSKTPKSYGVNKKVAIRDDMANQTTEVETNENKEKINIENTENNNSLKDILDKYEDLVDKYVDLLKKTSQGSYDTSTYSEYLKVLQEYTELAAEVNKMDTSKLSKEDYNYYLETTQRVLNKISSVYTK